MKIYKTHSICGYIFLRYAHGKRRYPHLGKITVPKLIRQMSEDTVKNAMPKEKQFVLFDGGGLRLLITPSGVSYGVLNTVSIIKRKSYL
jgi:hypothetical protein